MSLRIDALHAGSDAALAACSAVMRACFPRGAFELAVEVARPHGLVLSATIEARTVGFLLAWRIVDELHILSVGTLHEGRRAGVGRALVDAAIVIARDGGARRLLLEVARDNRAAVGLYRAAGFRVTNVRPAYYPDGSDALDMACDLDADGAVSRLPDEA